MVVKNDTPLKMWSYATLSATTIIGKASALLVLKTSRSRTASFKHMGNAAASGVDIEPDKREQRIRNTVFSGCQFIDNVGDGIEVFLAHTTDKSDDVTLRFENCYISSKHGTGIRVSKIGDGGPDGSIEFDNCTVENTVGYGIKVQEKSAKGARVIFTNCNVINAATDRQFGGEWSPISLSLPQPKHSSDDGRH